MGALKNVKVYIQGKGVVKTDVVWEGDRIVAVGRCKAKKDIVELGEGVWVPAFIDEHVHGAGGADAMDGTVEALQTISTTLAEEGTGAFLATTMTQSPEEINKALSAVADVMATGSAGADVLGVHLEGPFISKDCIGAQPEAYVAKPDVEVFRAYQNTAKNGIKLVSMAPEEDEDYRLVSHLHEQGVVVSAGHTVATYKQLKEAVAKGLSTCTHTYNRQSPLHHRDIGVVGGALLEDALTAEIICDTIHVSVPAMQLLVKNKPHDKVVLITDAMRAKGLGEGVSELGGQKVIVKDGQARLENGALAGSVLPMNVAVKNMVEKVGVSFADAVDFATVNPALNLGIERDYGTVAVGKKANLVLLGDDFSVKATMVNGKIVYRKQA